MLNLGQDLAYSIRTLIKDRGFTLASILTLALGIGANSAIFSVINSVLLKSFPYSDPERLVVLWERQLSQGVPRMVVSPPNFADWRAQNKTFEDIAAYRQHDFNLIHRGEPEQVRGLRISANLFGLLGVRPILGRDFYADEDQPGKPATVVISDALWRRRFGGDNQVIGQSVQLGSETATIIGVMPADFDFPPPIAFKGEARLVNVELFTQLRYMQETERSAHNLTVLGRIKQGLSIQQAQADLQNTTALLAHDYPGSNDGWDAIVVPLHEQVIGDVRSALLILPAAVGFVLLIACANVANLSLVRATRRQRELAIRSALGAGRLRLIRQMLIESSVLSVLAGIIGITVAAATLKVILSFAPGNIYRLQTVTIDGRVMAFTFLVSLLVAVVFGIFPAWQGSRISITTALKDSSGGNSGGVKRNGFRKLLVVTEIAVAIVVLTGAGLLIRSFIRLQHVSTGFVPDHLTAMTLSLPRSSYADLQQRLVFTEKLIPRLETSPGIRSVAFSNNLPLDLGLQGTSFRVVDQAVPPDHESHTQISIVSPNYFKTMGIPILRGREFTSADKSNAPGVVIISGYLAEHFFPNQDPIGKRVLTGFHENPLEIVGVAADTLHDNLKAESYPVMYLPYRQRSTNLPLILLLRSDSDAVMVATTVRQQVRELDSQLPLYDVKTMDQVLYSALGRPRFMTLLFGMFAGLAVLLALIGVYGVMSYVVAENTREIGIRLALGAQRSHILKLVLGQGSVLVLIGITIGVGVAFAVTRWMSSVLFGVTPTDPTTFISVSVLLAIVALVACYLPARRGAKVDPIIALRSE